MNLKLALKMLWAAALVLFDALPEETKKEFQRLMDVAETLKDEVV